MKIQSVYVSSLLSKVSVVKFQVACLVMHKNYEKRVDDSIKQNCDKTFIKQEMS